MGSSTSTSTSTPESFFPAAFSIEPLELRGCRCARCNVTSFPPRRICPGCGSRSDIEPAVLTKHGRLYSFTTVHQAPEHLPTPYHLGYVDLPEGVRLLAQIDPGDGKLEIGAEVTLIADRWHLTPAGEDKLVYKFKLESPEKADEPTLGAAS